MRFINFLTDTIQGPYSVGVKCAAGLVLTFCVISAVGGSAILINGLYWTWVRRSLKKSARLIAERAQRLGFESKA